MPPTGGQQNCEFHLRVFGIRRAQRGGWGISFLRVHAAAGETSMFPHSSRSQRGGIAMFAHLSGLGDLPISVDRDHPHALTRSQPTTAGRTRRLEYSGGLDLTRSLGRNATVTATVNPDFGQVEADPAVVNLSDFELQFSERRPLFVEDGELFRLASSLNLNPLFYSRRVGAPPAARVNAPNVEYPGETRIAIAERLVARRKDVAAGVMHALTLPAHATILDEAGVVTREGVAVPANYLVARVQSARDGGRRVAGLMATAFARPRDDLVDDYQRRAAGAVGMDFRTEFASRVWSLSGFAAASIIAGSNTSITAAQRSSARYFQRPDASTWTRFCSNREYGACRARLAREAGQHGRDHHGDDGHTDSRSTTTEARRQTSSSEHDVTYGHRITSSVREGIAGLLR